MHDPELRNSPWQDLLTLPLPPELEQVEGEYVRHRLLRETETMLEASTALALCPDPERGFPAAWRSSART